jgi:leucyl/phenylalanyl-tRNA--protein transferase
MRLRPYWLDPSPDAPFPPVEAALREPNGLLAIGGDLTLPRLLHAYASGIFPWYSPGEPILWWSPDPRCVFHTDRIHCARRLSRSIRQRPWMVRADTAFERVIDACAAPRDGHAGTWITAEMRAAYLSLHAAGHAHSIEVWDDDALVGGLYGVAVGRMFFAESMYSADSGASSLALFALGRHLAMHGWPLIDAQVESGHLLRLGARMLARAEFMQQVRLLTVQAGHAGSWRAWFGDVEAATAAIASPRP